MGQLSDKVAIVTGASRGVGKQIALALARAGAAVAAAAKSMVRHPKLPGTLPETVAEIEAEGGRAIAVKTDVRDEAQLEHLVDVTRERFGRIDIVINNAGALWWRPALETPVKRFDLMHQINARAPFLLSCLAARVMIERGEGGHIVMMSPPLDTVPHPGMVAYTMSKFGMTEAAIGLAAEWRPHRISVNALWPATMIRSLATIGWNLGDPRSWREPDILADAVLALVRKPPGETTGRQLIDEDFLREEGVTDFTRYRSVADSEPPRIDYAQIPSLMERFRAPRSDA